MLDNKLRPEYFYTLKKRGCLIRKHAGSHTMSIRTFILLLTLLLTGCFTINEVIDHAMAKKAEVVLRVKLVDIEGGSQEWDYDVEILKVLKNDSGKILTNRLSVAAFCLDPGVPEGVSTIYLEPEQTGWRLVGGHASTGVSHNKK